MVEFSTRKERLASVGAASNGKERLASVGATSKGKERLASVGAAGNEIVYHGEPTTGASPGAKSCQVHKGSR